MATIDLHALPLYPWAVWSRRVFVGALALMFTGDITGWGGESLVMPGFLLLLSFALIDSVANRLVFNHMKQALHIRGFRERARLGTAIQRVLNRDAFPGRSTSN